MAGTMGQLGWAEAPGRDANAVSTRCFQCSLWLMVPPARRWSRRRYLAGVMLTSGSSGTSSSLGTARWVMVLARLARPVPDLACCLSGSRRFCR